MRNGRQTARSAARRTRFVVAAFAMAVGSAACTQHTETSSSTATLQVSAESPEQLIDSFLQALDRSDEAALNRLRVDEREYRGVIIPGSVPEGQPLRKVTEKPSEFFWKTLDTKSRDFAQQLVAEFGGQHLVRRSHRFVEQRRYANYGAMGPTEVTVDTPSGDQKVIRTGWIAQIDGRYKFIGYEWD